MPSGNQEPRRNPELKRKAWMGAFSLSMLFWAELLWIITH